MPRIKDLTNYTGALNRSDIYFAVDGNSFSRGMSLSGQQVFTMCKGIDGKNIELRNSSTHIQWRWEGDSTWANLIAVSSLKGEDGKELEIRVQSGYIQTRLTGGTWASLIALDDLKGEKGDPADDPNLTFTMSALAPDATPTAEVIGVYPNLTVALGLPKGKDAANPNLAFVISALEWNETPTASVTGTYPDLTVNLGIPKGKDAANPNFTVNAIKGNPGENPEASITGTYPNLDIAFKIPEGEPAINPNLTFTVSALAPDATPTAEVIGVYPNLTVALGLPKGKDAANPNLAFVISALEWNETPTANVTGTYPDLTVNLGIPKGKDAANPNFTVNAIKGNPGENPEASITGTYPNLDIAFKIPEGEPAINPNLTFTVSALAPDATPTAEVIGVYPNLTVALGLPKGKDAANPNLAFVISALEWNETPTANVTGTYPDLTVNLGIPKGKDAANPNFTVNAIKGNPGENPEVSTSGTYPNLELSFKIPAGLRGLQGKPLIVLANGNYGNWNEVTEQYDDSGVQATATVDIENIPVVFTEAATRETINSEETVPAVFGKLKKWFSDLGSLAWKSKADYNTDIDNLPVFKQIFGESVLGAGDIAPENVKDITYDPITQAFIVSYLGGRVSETISMPADNFLANASYDGVTHILSLTMSNNNQVQVPLDDLIDEYKAANDGGLEVINGNEFKLTDGLKNKIDGIEAGAQKNVASIHRSSIVVTANWVEVSGIYTAIIYDSDITAAKTVMFSPSNDTEDTYMDAEIYNYAVTADGSLMLKSRSLPADSITINYSIIN